MIFFFSHLIALGFLGKGGKKGESENMRVALVQMVIFVKYIPVYFFN